MHDRCNKKNLSHLRTVLSMKLFLFLYKYISIHTLLKSVMQLINIMHHRGIVSIIYYLLYYYFQSPFLLLPCCTPQQNPPKGTYSICYTTSPSTQSLLSSPLYGTVGRRYRMSQHHCNTSNMCAAQTCRSQSCSHNRSRMTCSHAPFQADRRGCKNR